MALLYCYPFEFFNRPTLTILISMYTQSKKKCATNSLASPFERVIYDLENLREVAKKKTIKNVNWFSRYLEKSRVCHVLEFIKLFKCNCNQCKFGCYLVYQIEGLFHERCTNFWLF